MGRLSGLDSVLTGRSSVWSERPLWGREVFAGSNPAAPISGSRIVLRGRRAQAPMQLWTWAPRLKRPDVWSRTGAARATSGAGNGERFEDIDAFSGADGRATAPRFFPSSRPGAGSSRLAGPCHLGMHAGAGLLGACAGDLPTRANVRAVDHD